MKIIFDKPLILNNDIVLCATKHDIEIKAPIQSLEGNVKILGKTVVLFSTIQAKQETHICGVELTQTTKESKIFAIKNIIIGSGSFPLYHGFFATKGVLGSCSVVK